MLAIVIIVDNVCQLTPAKSFVYYACQIIKCLFYGFALTCNK